MCDVCFYEAFEEEREALRRYLPDAVRAKFVSGTIQESGDAAPPARFVSIRTQSVLPPEWAAGLDAVLSRSTGYDHLAAYRRAASNPELLYGYLPLYCARAVAEQAMLMWMALLRKLPAQQRCFKTFSRDGLTGGEAAGKTLAVVGVGHIGSEVVRIGAGLDMQVLGVDPVRKHDFVNYVSLESALPEADVLVVAMNLTEENRGYFDRARLAACKEGMILVNIARGELTPPSVLLALLREGKLGGVGLDVFAEEDDLAVALRRGEEPKGEEARAALELAANPNVLCTPHNAFNTHEALARKAEQTAAQVRHVLQEGRFVWPVP